MSAAAGGTAAGAENNTAAGTADTERDSPLNSWARIPFAHSAIDDAKATNPNYEPCSIEWAHNCQRCVPTYELRRRGFDVSVKPCPTEIVHGIFISERKVPKANDHLSHNPFDAWVPPESIHCPGGKQSIEEKMKEWGDGSRSEVMVLWEGQHGAGHVFVAEQIDGKTHFIDPQSGECGVEWYFDDCEPDKVFICRTDNKEISEHIWDCCS